MQDRDNVIIVNPMKDSYDFDFITRSLGLIPICNNSRAINAGAISFIRPRITETESGEVVWIEIGVHGGESFTLSPEEMAELETTIRRRAEEAKQLQKETFRDNILAQHEVLGEINNRVSPGMIVGAPVNKRGRN